MASAKRVSDCSVRGVRHQVRVDRERVRNGRTTPAPVTAVLTLMPETSC